MANQAIRQEINLTDVRQTAMGVVTFWGSVLMTTTRYSGTPTYWFEATYTGAAGNTGTIALQDVAAATDVATLSGATSATPVINRVQFTPTAGAREYLLRQVGDGVRNQSVNDARIIILQNEVSITATETQIEVGSWAINLSNTTVADITNPKFWKYTSTNWDGTTSFEVEVDWSTSAKNTVTITLCRTSDNAANVTVVNAGSSSTGVTRTRVSFTPVNGETYKLRSVASTSKSLYSITQGKIIVTQSNATSFTKVETQMLLLNGADVGTGQQSAYTKYNASEWNAGSGSITITHLMDSDNANNSAKIVTSAGADTGTSSTATGLGQQESAAFSLIDATTYDTNVINSTGTVAASRLKFLYAFSAAVARRIFVDGG